MHTTAFVTPVVEHWLEREIAQWVHHEVSIRRPITPWANTLTTELHLTPGQRKTTYINWLFGRINHFNNDTYPGKYVAHITKEDFYLH